MFGRMISKEEARAQLPRVGDVRWERPTIDKGWGHEAYSHTSQRCVVVEVQPEHLWYTVQFDNGIRESYKVPQLKTKDGGGGYG